MNASKFIATISGKALKALAAGAASIVATAAVEKLLAKGDEVADPIEMKPEEEPDVEVVDDEVQTDQTEETVEEVNED